MFQITQLYLIIRNASRKYSSKPQVCIVSRIQCLGIALFLSFITARRPRRRPAPGKQAGCGAPRILGGQSNTHAPQHSRLLISFARTTSPQLSKLLNFSLNSRSPARSGHASAAWQGQRKIVIPSTTVSQSRVLCLFPDRV